MRLIRGGAAKALLAALLFTIALPAGAQGFFDDNVARARIEEIKRQIDATTKDVNERLSRLEDRRGLVELSTQLEALRNDIARLRGQIELLQNQLDTADKRGKDLYVDIDT